MKRTSASFQMPLLPLPINGMILKNNQSYEIFGKAKCKVQVKVEGAKYIYFIPANFPTIIEVQL